MLLMTVAAVRKAEELWGKKLSQRVPRKVSDFSGYS
jgi:hypothetical protein